MRIDRVVADEVEEVLDPLSMVSCPAAWKDDPLPDWVPYRSSIHSPRSRPISTRGCSQPWCRRSLAFNPEAVSRAGARGLTQLMPAAASDHLVENVFDPDENLRGGADHLRLMLDRFKSLPLALAAYNAGAATVERYDGIPPYRETQGYVRRILTAFCPVEGDG